MATFNQNNQTVGVQYNAENMIVSASTSAADLAAQLDRILGEGQREEPLTPEAQAELEAARDAAASGDTAATQSRLRRALELGSLATGIGAQVAAMLGALGG
ncbi:hypothetical protein [Streptomyces sp. NPDC047985]|uniref:hypothetical protein n=1 Tax=Streptomyces sp. NPDC047985 TaxID=3155384 RepID=UPI0034482A34